MRALRIAAVAVGPYVEVLVLPIKNPLALLMTTLVTVFVIAIVVGTMHG